MSKFVRLVEARSGPHSCAQRALCARSRRAVASVGSSSSAALASRVPSCQRPSSALALPRRTCPESNQGYLIECESIKKENNTTNRRKCYVHMEQCNHPVEYTKKQHQKMITIAKS